MTKQVSKIILTSKEVLSFVDSHPSHGKFICVVDVPHYVLHQNGKLICEAENNEKITWFRLSKVVLHGEINEVF